MSGLQLAVKLQLPLCMGGRLRHCGSKTGAYFGFIAIPNFNTVKRRGLGSHQTLESVALAGVGLGGS